MCLTRAFVFCFKAFQTPLPNLYIFGAAPSFPEYFEVEEYWLDQYRGFFRWLIFALSLPSFFYSASGYYVSAYKSIRSKMLNIDIPIALGIVVMFVRSTFDIIMDYGSGFFDSLCGLIFFMLLGKMFQI